MTIGMISFDAIILIARPSAPMQPMDARTGHASVANSLRPKK
jgi:hypothetical protein